MATNVKQELRGMLDEILRVDSASAFLHVVKKYGDLPPGTGELTWLLLLKRELTGGSPFKVRLGMGPWRVFVSTCINDRVCKKKRGKKGKNTPPCVSFRHCLAPSLINPKAGKKRKINTKNNRKRRSPVCHPYGLDV